MFRSLRFISCACVRFVLALGLAVMLPSVTLAYYDQRDENNLDAFLLDGPPLKERLPHRRRPPYRSANPAKGGAIDPARGFTRLFPVGASYDGGHQTLDPHRAHPKALEALAKHMVEHRHEEDYGDSAMPAGYTFLAQFIDHDITLDTTTKLDKALIGYAVENARTPELDLDSVYAGGPERAPYLYNLPYLRVGEPVADGRYDLLRTDEENHPGPLGGRAVALIGDPRNDENLIISQLHAMFVSFHNRMADRIILSNYAHLRTRFCHSRRHCHPEAIAKSLPRKEKIKIYESAHDLTVHYYHRVIAEDYLPRIIGLERTIDIFRHGRDFYYPKGFRKHDGGYIKPAIPVEFALAAFRYGHSQVRNSYQLNHHTRRNLFAGPGERRKGGGLRAFQRIPEDAVIDWRYFFPLDPIPPKKFNWARKLDRSITQSLHELDLVNAVGKGELGSLPARNLLRAHVYKLPSGQQIASVILPALEKRGALANWGANLHDKRRSAWRRFLLPPDRATHHALHDAETPLWYYVLQEAEAFGHRSSYPAALAARDLRDAKRLSRHGPGAPFRFAAHSGDAYGEEALGGHTLGPVGGTIVGEVLAGLLEHYQLTTGKGLGYKPGVKPDHNGPAYNMRDFLHHAAFEAHETRH